MKQLGFMQGRLVPPVNNKIQAFPTDTWEIEFELAKKAKLSLMEWTLDLEGLYANPIMNELGRKKIQDLSNAHGLDIRSVTGDFFMQEPFFHDQSLPNETRLIEDLKNVIDSCVRFGIEILVIPLVDQSSISAKPQLVEKIRQIFSKVERFLFDAPLKIAFETDLNPESNKNFILQFNSSFGLNFDIGNSASLGFDPVREIRLLDSFIIHIHVKDRLLFGHTVRLGEGDVNFPLVFNLLRESDKAESRFFILQTARSTDGKDLEDLAQYKCFVEEFWN